MFTDLRWTKYKAIGTDRELRSMYIRFEFFSAVKKLDVQFSLVVLVTGLVFFHRTELEMIFAIINGLLIFVEIAWEISGNRAIKRGSVGYAILFFALSLLMPTFVMIVSVLTLSNYPILDGAQQAGAESEVVGLLLCAVFNRLLTMGCMASMVCAFGTSGYAKLRLLFARKAQRVIEVHGMRPPPVPICGCDFARCARTCGPRCAAFCCDKPRQAAWAMTGGYDSESDGGGGDGGRGAMPAWRAGADKAGKTVELSQAKTDRGAAQRAGSHQTNPASSAALRPPEVTREALAQPRDSFAAAYMAATTNQARAELKPPVIPERSRSEEADGPARGSGSFDSGAGRPLDAAGRASAPRGAAQTATHDGGGDAPDVSDAASTMTGASSRGGRERRRERRAARQANRGVGAT